MAIDNMSMQRSVSTAQQRVSRDATSGASAA
jgi:hypothetical protein